MTPILFASAATGREISRARAIVVLVGGYDGSGNYGDVALAQAALDLVGRLGEGLLVLPLLERTRLEDHLQLQTPGSLRAPRPIYFDPDGGLEDDLLPVAAPAELAFGGCYLYGGGYLNGSWGDRKLAMLRAAEGLFAAADAGHVSRVASGLQVEAGWLEGLDHRDAAALRAFDLLGARDPASASALSGLGSAAPLLETGDDAIGVLPAPMAASDSRAIGESLQVNVHFSEHGWVSERPREWLDYFAGLVTELGRRAGRPLLIQPLVAYADRRTDEGAAAERLGATCTTLGAEVAQPVVLPSANLAQLPSRLGTASLTLSCSFHVALTSLMLGVPATLLGDNPYYAQKAAGLVADFDLPAALTIPTLADPAAKAAEIAALLFDPTAATRLDADLAACAERLRRRRQATETELLGRLGGAALTALSEHGDELAERLRERAAEPAELHAQLAAMRTEIEELERLVGRSPLEAELRAQEAEERATAAEQRADTAAKTLAETLGSRSWRLAAPARRVGALLRRD